MKKCVLAFLTVGLILAAISTEMLLKKLRPKTENPLLLVAVSGPAKNNQTLSERPIAESPNQRPDQTRQEGSKGRVLSQWEKDQEAARATLARLFDLVLLDIVRKTAIDEDILLSLQIRYPDRAIRHGKTIVLTDGRPYVLFGGGWPQWYKPNLPGYVVQFGEDPPELFSERKSDKEAKLLRVALVKCPDEHDLARNASNNRNNFIPKKFDSIEVRIFSATGGASSAITSGVEVTYLPRYRDGWTVERNPFAFFVVK